MISFSYIIAFLAFCLLTATTLIAYKTEKCPCMIRVPVTALMLVFAITTQIINPGTYPIMISIFLFVYMVGSILEPKIPRLGSLLYFIANTMFLTNIISTGFYGSEFAPFQVNILIVLSIVLFLYLNYFASEGFKISNPQSNIEKISMVERNMPLAVSLYSLSFSAIIGGAIFTGIISLIIGLLLIFIGELVLLINDDEANSNLPIYFASGLHGLGIIFTGFSLLFV